MLPIFGYLAVVSALFVGAALGLTVLLGESAGIGKNFGAYADAKAVATAKPIRLAGADLDASAAARTTGEAAQSDRPGIRKALPKPPKNRSAHVDKRRKRTVQAVR